VLLLLLFFLFLCLFLLFFVLLLAFLVLELHLLLSLLSHLPLLSLLLLHFLLLALLPVLLPILLLLLLLFALTHFRGLVLAIQFVEIRVLVFHAGEAILLGLGEDAVLQGEGAERAVLDLQAEGHWGLGFGLVLLVLLVLLVFLVLAGLGVLLHVENSLIQGVEND
jgi:hypothetical protein